MFLETSTQNIRRRVAIIGVVLIVTPMLTLSLAAWAVLHRLKETSGAEQVPSAAPRADVTRLANQLLEKCKRYREQAVDALKRGQQILNGKGAAKLDGTRRSTWHARNEVTGQIKAFEVPLMAVGEEKFVAVSSFDLPGPAVDEITKATGARATVFQKLNDRGDLLRVASSVKSTDGNRQINSFVPGDGRTAEQEAIFREVLDGHASLDSQRVGSETFLTAYQPLKNSHGGVIGILETELSEEPIKKEVRELLAKSAGPDGPELFILEAGGAQRVRAILMSDASLEGADLWNEKDRAGRLYVQELCSRALHLTDETWADYQYQRSKRTGGIPRNVTARFTFLPELHWVVGLAKPEQDSMAGMPLGQALIWAMWLLFGVGVASTGLAVRIWIEFSRDFALKLTTLFDQVRRDAKQLSEVAMELSHEAEHAMVERTAPETVNHQASPWAAQETTTEVRAERRAIPEEARNLLRTPEASREALRQLIAAIEQINAAPEAASTVDLRALASEIRESAYRLQADLEESRQNSQRNRPDLPTPHHASGDDSTASLRRQSDALMRLAAGLDHTMDSVSQDLGVVSHLGQEAKR